MILDYAYDNHKRSLSVSYITQNGGKKILEFNTNRFKTYYSTPSGKYINWDGSRCDVRYTSDPKNFDIKTFFKELSSKYRELLTAKFSPRLYTFDIETEISDEFPEPSEAKYPITNISIASPELNVIVLGTKELDNDANLQNRFINYLNDSKFFKSLGLQTPKIQYVKFATEHDMIEYFLKNIVAKVPMLAGWNSITFDWQYIQNRIRGYYPDLSIKEASINKTVSSKNYTDMKNNKIRLNMPNHTLILDMMDVVDNFDQVVMPIKESTSLDYIASESIGMHKIEYDGDLQQLYENDYSTYVFYNAIDSILVQLIDKKFKTLQNIFTQSIICEERIGSCFSKIALSEALFFNFFYEHDIKIVPIDVNDRVRGRLLGAYVAKPVPGLHRFVCCNDFSSLYPSIIRSNNISIENLVGTFYDEEKLEPYRKDLSKYIVICGSVYKNAGTLAKPEIGDFVAKYLLEDELDVYRNDPNYFVSVNGHVYKNEKDYSFKIIQTNLANNRNASKYLAKQLDAFVISDIDHIINQAVIGNREYPQPVIDWFKEKGMEVNGTKELYIYNNLVELKEMVSKEVTYLSSFEQACKLLMNSLYGGSSHVAFAFFSLELANDITGEARNLIHLMEDHIPNWFQNNWLNNEELHNLLNINIKPNYNSSRPLTKVVAGDTDSIYLSYEGLLDSIEGSESMTIEQKRDILVNLNLKFLDAHNNEFMTNYYNKRHAKSVHNFELETICMSECRLNVKKRYAQLLLWKDGKIYDVDKLPMKTKGLEMIKSSYPKQARESLKELVRFLLEDKSNEFLLQRLNIEMQKQREVFNNADIEDVCGNVKVQNYTNYILDDNNALGVQVAPKCPYNAKALGNYNNIRNVNNLPGDPIYGGKVKWYYYRPNGIKSQRKEPDYFAFQSRKYPKWAAKYAPIDREAMFEKTVLAPFNRILNAANIGELKRDGSMQMELFF